MSFEYARSEFQCPLDTAAEDGGVEAPRRRALTPTVFLPGLLCDQALWRPQVSALADLAAPHIADITLDDSVERMAARVLLVAPPRFSLVGLSMGGYVALEIMRQAPERVTRLALFSTGARADTAERKAARLENIRSLQRGRFIGITHRLLDHLVHASNREGRVADELRAMAQRVGGEAYIRQQQAIMTRRDAAELLQTIRVPTLVAVGDADRVTPPCEAEFIRDNIAGASLSVIADCGHLPALERPAETTALLREWLSR